MEQQNKNMEQTDNEGQEEEHTGGESYQSKETKGNGGSIVGIVVIVIILIFGGLYFWGANINKQAQVEESAVLNDTANNNIATPNDEPSKIESDLKTFDTASFDAGLNSDLKAVESKI